MSHWTQIVGVLRFNTYQERFKTSDEFQAFCNEVLKYAPKITGSEGDAEVYANVAIKGPAMSTTADCKNCLFLNTRKTLKNGQFSCWSPDDYKCEYARYLSAVTITINGYLRDKQGDKTRKELKEFISYFTSKRYGLGWELDMKSVSIKG